MEQARKQLKIYSIALLIYTLASMAQVAFGLWFGDFDGALIPEGAPENLLLIAKIAVAVIALLLCIPQVYVGVKGILVAKNPTSSIRHVFWAKILFIIAIFGIVFAIVDLFFPGNTSDEIGNVLSLAVDVFIYYDYIKYATIVAREA